MSLSSHRPLEYNGVTDCILKPTVDTSNPWLNEFHPAFLESVMRVNEGERFVCGFYSLSDDELNGCGKH